MQSFKKVYKHPAIFRSGYFKNKKDKSCKLFLVYYELSFDMPGSAFSIVFYDFFSIILNFSELCDAYAV